MPGFFFFVVTNDRVRFPHPLEYRVEGWDYMLAQQGAKSSALMRSKVLGNNMPLPGPLMSTGKSHSLQIH